MKMTMPDFGEKCSKFATGDVIIMEAIFAAFLVYVVLVFAIAFWMALRRSKNTTVGNTRTWLVHGSVALLVAAGPALPFVYLDVRAHIESARWKKQFELDRAHSVAWKDRLTFAPGNVRKDLDRALATMPQPYLMQYGADVLEAPPGKARADIKDKIVEQLERPNLEWTQEDLAAFDSMADNADIGITVLTAWARDRTNLPGVAAMCSQPTRAHSQSQDCRHALGTAVGKWCQVYGARCEELAKEESFRKVVTGAGVVLQRQP